MEYKGFRRLIRAYLKGVEWCNPRNVSILIYGDPTQYNWADTELIEMVNAKRVSPADSVKRLTNIRHHIFATPSSKKKDKGDFNIEHDIKLRDVIAKHLFLNRWEGLGTVSVQRIAGNPDAHIGRLYFELDNGHEDDSQLSEKLKRYSGKGAFQVAFIMAHRYGDRDLESKRLAKLFDLSKKILRHKPNRILGAAYSEYLENGRLSTFKD
jgi:hypothetical protein